MTAEVDPVVALAAKVADGQHLAWSMTESSVAFDEGSVVEQLAILAKLSALHQGLPPVVVPPDCDGEAGRAVRAPDAADALFDWGTLRVIEHVGGGSFGDVYRAWDLTLDREVALKLYRAAATDALTNRQAALKEAQLLARIQHPSVMAIYGFREIDGQIGIWGEFLRGRTLAEIVQADGPMNANEAAVAGDAVSHAVAVVHQAGILHRDVKAQNVIRAYRGRLVLADFGLGIESDGRGQPGAGAAGTPAYLAPELFRGEAATARSDVYSVGVLMFYLVTGSFPVTGQTTTELARNHETGTRQRLHELRPDLPHAFVQVVERALDADPGGRFASAAEFRTALNAAVGRTAAEAPQQTAWRLGAMASMVLAAAATAWLVAGLQPQSSAPDRVLAFTLPPPDNASLTEGSRNVAAVSPDGTRVVFVGTEPSGDTKLFIRRLDSASTQPLDGARAAASPFWSPDGRQIAFFGASHLQRIPAAGGPIAQLAPAPENCGGTWGDDGTILFSPTPRDGILRVDPRTNQVEPLTTPDKVRGEIGHLWPHLLPGSRSFTYFISSNDPGIRGIYLGFMDGRAPRRVVAASASGVFANGFLLYPQNNLLVAQKMSPDDGTLTGDPLEVVRDIAVTWTGRGAFTASTNGVLVYSTNKNKDSRQLTWYDDAGRPTAHLETPQLFRNPALSQSGRQLAVQRYVATISELRLYDLERGGWTRLGKREESAELPVWSPEEQHLAFASKRHGYLDIYVQDVQSTGEPQPIWISDTDKMPTDWSPDGSQLAVVEMGKQDNYDLLLVPINGGPRVPVAATDAHEISGRFSPDGRRLAYASNESDRFEIYVQDMPPLRSRRRVSTQGGYDPSWLSPDRLVYMDPSGTLMEVTVPRDARTSVPRAEELFSTRVETPGSSRNHYALHAETRRFLLNEPLVDAGLNGLNVLVNWLGVAPASTNR